MTTQTYTPEQLTEIVRWMESYHEYMKYADVEKNVLSVRPEIFKKTYYDFRLSNTLFLLNHVIPDFLSCVPEEIRANLEGICGNKCDSKSIEELKVILKRKLEMLERIV